MPDRDEGLSEQPNQSEMLIRAERVEFSGPLPSPGIIREYESILPGSADRIFALAESEATHRRGLETRSLEAAIDDQTAFRIKESRGQWCGIVVAVLGLSLSAAIAVWGNDTGAYVVSSVLGGGTLVGLVTIFVIGRRSRAADSNDADRSRESD
jgi:uncharacterized membrane protein